MIDHHYRCIFIHQRKAAGSSIISAFADEHPDVDKRRYNGGVLGKDWINRQSPEDGYFVFSAVRNPFDRLVSAWKYLSSLRGLPLEEVLNNLPREGHDYRHITKTQVEMIVSPASGRLIVEDLIRYEQLQSDFDRICGRLGKPKTQLKRVNRSDRDRDYRKYYTPELRALVEVIFKMDLDYFNYDF